MTQNEWQEIDRKIVGDIYTTPVIRENLRTLTDDFGSRFGGTEGERLAAEFLRDQLVACGLENVAMEPVAYTGWQRGEARLEILEPVQQTIDCISLPHSPAGVVEAELVDLGDAAPARIVARGEELTGKIAMVNSVVSPPRRS